MNMKLGKKTCLRVAKMQLIERLLLEYTPAVLLREDRRALKRALLLRKKALKVLAGLPALNDKEKYIFDAVYTASNYGRLPNPYIYM